MLFTMPQVQYLATPIWCLCENCHIPSKSLIFLSFLYDFKLHVVRALYLIQQPQQPRFFTFHIFYGFKNRVIRIHSLQYLSLLTVFK